MSFPLPVLLWCWNSPGYGSITHTLTGQQYHFPAGARSATLTAYIQPSESREIRAGPLRASSACLQHCSPLSALPPKTLTTWPFPTLLCSLNKVLLHLTCLPASGFPFRPWRNTQSLGAALCECLPACHDLIGCDTTSSLYRIGKTTAFTRLKTHLTDLKKMAKFLPSGSLKDALPVARKYALLLYGQKKKENGHPCTNLDELRHTLAFTTDSSAANPSPTEDAFQQLVLRALCQPAVWHHSHLAKPHLWNPDGRGWRLRQDGSIEPIMFQKAQAPKEARDITHLYSKD